ncbi:MAG TPA: hemerythrin domain-containing protein [Terriglobales bacterium]|nr:hemerythrin domain-containing protein [Terriglobales bacterium]
MLRDRNLIPLSRQHQHALALCVRLERDLQSGAPSPEQLTAWQVEIEQLFQSEVRYHFEAEEKLLFPVARRQAGLRILVDELLAEHVRLRALAQQAAVRSLDAPGLQRFAETLSAHIRKEERHLFESYQTQVPAAEMERVGAAVEEYFQGSGMPEASCALRPRK